MAGPRPYCKKHVFSGERADFSGHQCGHRALPGSDFCHLHTQDDADHRAPATAPAQVETAQRTTYFATLTWRPGQGPVVKPPYRDGFGFVTKLMAKATDDHRPEVSVEGVMRKKDGTAGIQRWDATWKAEETVPEECLDALLTELELERERRG